MTADEAEAYHRPQVESLAAGGVDFVSVVTITYPAEAVGVVRASQATGIDVAVALTVETDGRLPDGHTIGEAISAIDAATDDGPAYYMINCAHPTHFMDAIDAEAAWLPRLRAIRANASAASHAELDEAETLDDGDPIDLGMRLARIRQQFDHITLVGGCCGTDERHIEQIGRACTAG